MNFDPMLSDVHSPIHMSSCVKETKNLNFSDDVSTSSNVNKNFIKWKSERNEESITVEWVFTSFFPLWICLFLSVHYRYINCVVYITESTWINPDEYSGDSFSSVTSFISWRNFDNIVAFLTFTSLNLVLLWQLFYLFCSSIVINTVIVTAGVRKGNNKITELRTILQTESQNS
jgi:hypothetical protein